MSDKEKTIKLYPSNWLYNAGVVGLLEVINYNEDNLDAQSILMADGGIKLDSESFKTLQIGQEEVPYLIKKLVDFQVSDQEVKEWKKQEKKKNGKKYTYEEYYKSFEKKFGTWGYKFVKAGNSLFASKTPFQNLVQLKEWQEGEFSDIVKKFPYNLHSENSQDPMCSLCLSNKSLKTQAVSKLEKRLTKLQISHLKELGASLGEFPNSFWNLNESLPICYFCAILILHHRIPLIRLSDRSEIFINVPSFKLMYYLNRFAREAFGTENAQENRNKREILATSAIEYATKIQSTLGTWSSMNIEIISKQYDKIEFFSLPYKTIQLISDRRIASLLSALGEFRILNLVLDGKYSRLVNDAYNLMRIGLKPYSEREPQENDFINNYLYRWINKEKPAETAHKMLKLYALIEQKQKYNTYGRSKRKTTNA